MVLESKLKNFGDKIKLLGGKARQVFLKDGEKTGSWTDRPVTHCSPVLAERDKFVLYLTTYVLTSVAEPKLFV
jgi:hypothetical protein